jgi:alpha-glucosidase
VIEPTFAPETFLRGWKPAGAGALRLELGGGAACEVAIARDGAVRLRANAGGSLAPDPSDAVGREPWRPSSAEPYAVDGGSVVMRFEGPEGQATLEIGGDPLAFRVRERDGTPVATLSGLGFAPDGRARIALETTPDECFFGFGEKSGGLDKRGRLLRMRSQDANLRVDADPLYASIPFFLGFRQDAGRGRAVGTLLDAFAPSSFDVASADPDRVWMETSAGGLDVTIFPGPRPADVLRRFTARVGRTPLPPRWALGHHQSRWSYASEREVRQLAREIRRRGIPTDVIHLDIDYMHGFRVFTWNARRFPNPNRLLRELASDGFRVVTIIDPGVKVDREYPVYQDGRARDAFCRNADGSPYTLMVWPKTSALPDFNRPDVRRWWGEQHQPLLDAGVAGIWNDMNEPAGWQKEIRIGRLILPRKAQDMSGVVQADPVDPERRVPHESVRNLYAQQECRATRGFLEEAQPDRRAFVLSRSGHAGIQRHAALWTGDNASRWSHLRESLPMLMNLSLSGVAFCGADIGGFAWSCTPELYARWIQIGALYPLARTHSMLFVRRQEPWRFGRRVEAIAKAALELRMRLLPYLEGVFRESEATGAPVWRPLFYEFPDDLVAPGLEDQVMVGPLLLAAPILERGARAREVYLPAGIWTRLRDGARFAGPTTLRVAAPLDVMPLFVRGGAVLPTQSPVRHVLEAPAEPLVLEVFSGGDAELDLVEDDGETLGYRRGVVARTQIRLFHRAGGRMRLELGARQGSFEVTARTLRVVFHGSPPPRAVLLDARPLAERVTAPGYVARDGRVHVFLEDDGRAHALELEPAP